MTGGDESTKTEEEVARFLLTPLRDDQVVPAGPSRIDVTAAITRGRRRIRVRRLFGAGCAAAAVLVAVVSVPVVVGALRADRLASSGQSAYPSAEPFQPASPEPTATGPTPPTRCAVRRLADPDKTGRTVVTGVDPSGRFIVGRNYPGGSRQQQILIWEDGRPVRVRMAGQDQLLTDINSAGVAIGTSYQGKDLRAWVYADGKVSRLPGTAVTPVAIGETSVIVGSRIADRLGVHSVPVIWRAIGDDPTDLPLPGKGWSGVAVGVAPDGSVVGTISERPDLYPYTRGVVWTPDGTMHVLPLPTEDGRTADGFAPIAVGERWIVGRATFTEGTGRDPVAAAKDAFGTRPMRYDRITGEFESYPTDSLRTEAGNGSGWLVGAVEADHPVLLTEAGALSLPKVAKFTEHMAAGLSGDGRVIVGQAFAGGTRAQALAWDCY